MLKNKNNMKMENIETVEDHWLDDNVEFFSNATLMSVALQGHRIFSLFVENVKHLFLSFFLGVKMIKRVRIHTSCGNIFSKCSISTWSHSSDSACFCDRIAASVVIQKGEYYYFVEDQYVKYLTQNLGQL